MGEIMLPVVNVLQHLLKVNSIQLCPIAAFTSIPLHAGAMSGGSLYLLIHTHTLSALIGSRQMMKRRVDTVRLSCQSDKVNRGSWLLTALLGLSGSFTRKLPTIPCSSTHSKPCKRTGAPCLSRQAGIYTALHVMIIEHSLLGERRSDAKFACHHCR